MKPIILFLFFTALLIRLISLFISIKNENSLKISGAFEYGKFNSTLLMISHASIYSFCFVEAYIKQPEFDLISLIGTILLLFSIFMLFIVISKLKHFWTFKLYIAKDHILNKSFLFKYFRHPNYFFNVIPELLGIILICKAWAALIILFPLHMFFLGIRIHQENIAMGNKFFEY